MTAPAKKSELLGLLFPYDWPNPAISDVALILNVLERGIYEDICRVCAHFGLDAIERQRCPPTSRRAHRLPACWATLKRDLRVLELDSQIIRS